MEKKAVLYDPAQCPCQRVNCERNHNCTACQAFHHARGELTRCERQAQQTTK